ncbi:MAG: hypothetical protein BZY80_06625 [SAR202 cluster bacterium Io17-Chloro-G2]|nr:MAG: hypothetical protein BZY80_06625 [SAR202 cluster bacterium Io17-Chloro-G2]
MTQQESTPPATPDASIATCTHHWTIQPATGPVSQGVCRICGEVREFKNYVEAATWGDSRLSNKSNSDDSQGSVKPVAKKNDTEDADKDGNEDDE